MTTSSPSSRKPRVPPSGRASGSRAVRRQLDQRPALAGLGPLTVPEAKRSPVRSDAPLTVMWASICAGVQYIERTAAGRRRGRSAGPPARGRAPTAGSASSRYGSGRGRAAGRLDAGRASSAASGDDPRRDRRRERLAEERAERHVLPGLDVAGRPVVDQADAEHVPANASTGDRRAARRARADDEAHLGLDVEPPGRPEDRPRRPAVRRWPRGRRTGDAGDDDRARAAVVADRQVLPVGVQRVLLRPEDRADVRGVVLAGVEVDVVGRP